MANVIGDGLHAPKYEAKSTAWRGLFWLFEVEAKNKEGDWSTSVDAALARKIKARFGGKDLSFKAACDHALRQALVLQAHNFDFEAAAAAEAATERALALTKRKGSYAKG